MNILLGALCGLFATLPMTGVMKLLHVWPRRQKSELPPHRITQRVLAGLGVRHRLEEEEQVAATAAAHLAFGAAAGALYAPLEERVPGPEAIKGTVFGILVWLISYAGWIPKAGLMPHAKHQSRQQNWMMFMAHIVWGVVLGMSLRWLRDGARR